MSRRLTFCRACGVIATPEELLVVTPEDGGETFFVHRPGLDGDRPDGRGNCFRQGVKSRAVHKIALAGSS